MSSKDLPAAVERALARAYKQHAAKSLAQDAALLAEVMIRYHGDDAARVLALAADMAKEMI